MRYQPDPSTTTMCPGSYVRLDRLRFESTGIEGDRQWHIQEVQALCDCQSWAYVI